MQQGSSTDEIIVEKRGNAGLIRLNRPKAINSLNQAMVSGMKEGLDAFARDPDITCVILSGEGERGLCAGGDVREIHAAKAASEADRTRFWREEFPLNYTISHYPKPYIALMDGIVMGGGVGVSAHGRYRVVTERARLAMPETAIGYFPDVGASWLLPKAPGEAGTWLGLTGREIGAADAIYAGLAGDHVASERLAELVQALADVSFAADVGAVIEGFSSKPAVDGFLASHQEQIDAAFGFDAVEDIIEALASTESDFARETLATLQLRSPTSLKLTLRLLRFGRESSGLVECLEREFAAGCEVLRNPDFYEGVRAALIDKDRNPKWRPETLAQVSDEDIDRYFVSAKSPLFANHRL
ncbi:enoyl-CoA hydratase/isomerase family protein [Agrobacterium rubi]|uniref:enoyl-CoA hydratase/isomerase family protein n=1 Tax=Agrobacterium rubi TaxID=28099 RepID=UPI0015732173|nr:enoyl-CoA hydratase/isomerase family protein [Agrobacterium rubi]NTF08542.1 enoyl-CoA hydratase/isomerase family protein [Agrobacterium rubi]NTF20770.1 enoyl-CoA hydratase/isomerase family protein [Agrobacterium rubi]NTF29750.1 enoyl-CoA hydratase/isomerase family protein [Agrobacterium rubi]